MADVDNNWPLPDGWEWILCGEIQSVRWSARKQYSYSRFTEVHLSDGGKVQLCANYGEPPPQEVIDAVCRRNEQHALPGGWVWTQGVNYWDARRDYDGASWTESVFIDRAGNVMISKIGGCADPPQEVIDAVIRRNDHYPLPKGWLWRKRLESLYEWEATDGEQSIWLDDDGNLVPYYLPGNGIVPEAVTNAVLKRNGL